MALFKSKKNESYGYSDGYYSVGDLSFTANEALKLLRTNLTFSLVNEGCKVIAITSPNRAEGKSTLALNLAETIANDGKRVILIDGDLRLPSIATKLNIKPVNGLSNVLSNQISSRDLIIKVDKLNFSIIPSGPLPPNPSELIGSSRMESLITKLRDFYDYVIIDLPPINVVSDALAISNYVDGYLIVVREHLTEKKELKEALEKLKLIDGKVIGTVLTFDTNISKKYKKKYKSKYKYNYDYKYKYSYDYSYGRKRKENKDEKNNNSDSSSI